MFLATPFSFILILFHLHWVEEKLRVCCVVCTVWLTRDTVGQSPLATQSPTYLVQYSRKHVECHHAEEYVKAPTCCKDSHHTRHYFTAFSKHPLHTAFHFKILRKWGVVRFTLKKNFFVSREEWGRKRWRTSSKIYNARCFKRNLTVPVFCLAERGTEAGDSRCKCARIGEAGAKINPSAPRSSRSERQPHACPAK